MFKSQTGWMIMVMVLLTGSVASAASSDMPVKKIGMTASLAGADLGIMVPIWIKPSLSVLPFIRFLSAEDLGHETALGAKIRLHKEVDTDFFPYIGAGVGTYYSTAATVKAIDRVVGMLLGAEYFVKPRVSLGLESQVTASFSDENSYRFGNPGKKNINTASLVYFSVYFK